MNAKDRPELAKFKENPNAMDEEQNVDQRKCKWKNVVLLSIPENVNEKIIWIHFTPFKQYPNNVEKPKCEQNEGHEEGKCGPMKEKSFKIWFFSLLKIFYLAYPPKNGAKTGRKGPGKAKPVNPINFIRK